MKWNVSDEVAETLDLAAKQVLIPDFDPRCPPVIRRAEIEKLLPHRDPFLFLDEILYMDPERGIIAARYDLARGEYILSGHFPGEPTWPGIFQVEGITQAGGLLYNRTHKLEGGPGVMTNVLAARFMERITPGADLIVIAQNMEFGPMTDVVGQTLQNGKICSVAATRFYSLSEDF